ncbi:MerR family transcriptional regulator [Paenibacillus pedocola]|uniref:MerR family transcriptional regulator n=1 Tax=Paenibacillus pedocola TaxID=3242193 RepID=UPI0028778F4F|nr:MerR family transcriptional regulator [Paenibacillus typhae]
MEFFSIGEVSKLCSIPVKTLRYYDEIGLLRPDKISDENHYRYYSKESALKIPLIKYYKQLGFRLDDIKELIGVLDIGVLSDFFTKELKSVEKQIADLQKKHFAITEWSKLLRHGEAYLTQPDTNGRIDVRTIPSYQTVHFRYELKEGQNHEEMLYSPSFVELCQRQDVFAYGPFMLRFNSLEERINGTFRELDAYTSVIEEEYPGVETFTLGGFQAITAIHKGSYSRIADTYHKLTGWARQHNFKFQGAAYERNIIDPWSTRVPEHYVTELIVPIVS